MAWVKLFLGEFCLIAVAVVETCNVLYLVLELKGSFF